MSDIIIIGGGPAGLTAGIYAGRAGFSPIVVEQMFLGGQAATTHEIRNYPGFDQISGAQIAERLEKHALGCSVEVVREQVTGVSLGGTFKEVVLGDRTLQARAVILALGARPRLLGVEGEVRLIGRGVSYCATCDGMFFKGKEIAVVGGGNTAVQDALYLAQICSKVYLIHRRDTLRADSVLQQQMKHTPNIIPLWNTVITAVTGTHMVEGLQLQGTDRDAFSTLPVSGLFVAVGTQPHTEMVADQVQRDGNGNIIVDVHMQTNLPGVYAAGDVRSGSMRQIVTAAADGAIAGAMAAQYVLRTKEEAL